MSDLKKQLIKLGSTNPELRSHIRPLLQRVASKDAYTTSRNLIKKGLNDIERDLSKEKKKLVGSLQKLGLNVNEGQSYITYEVHGSDGLRVYGSALFSDSQGRDRYALEDSIEQSGVLEYFSLKALGKGWQLTFGD